MSSDREHRHIGLLDRSTTEEQLRKYRRRECLSRALLTAAILAVLAAIWVLPRC